MAMNQQQLDEYWRLKNQGGVEDLSGPIGKGYGDKPQGLMGRSGYEDAILKRQEANRTPATDGVPASGGETATKTMASPQAAEAAQAAGEGNGIGAVGGGMMAMGAATANPYLLAGGLALKAVSAGEEKKRANEEKQRVEYNERITRRQQMMNQIGQMRIE